MRVPKRTMPSGPLLSSARVDCTCRRQCENFLKYLSGFAKLCNPHAREKPCFTPEPTVYNLLTQALTAVWNGVAIDKVNAFVLAITEVKKHGSEAAG